MSRQVSGSEKTLINAIREGDVPNPPLLDWNNWQVWRRDLGLRPVVARDGFVTSTTTELALRFQSLQQACCAESLLFTEGHHKDKHHWLLLSACVPYVLASIHI